MKDAIQKRIDKAIEDQDSLTHIKLRKLPEHLRVMRDELAPKYTGETCSSTRVGSWKSGFETGALAVLEEAEKLVDALEGLTNAALADIKPLPSQIESGFYALQAYRDKFEVKP